MGMSTVAVIEAGIGALSLGFKEAGYQVVAAFEEDKKAVEAYRRNLNEIYECSLLELLPEDIPDTDVIAIDLMKASPFKKEGLRQEKEDPFGIRALMKIQKIIDIKRPLAFCFVMKKRMGKSVFLTNLLEEMSNLGYYWEWKVVSVKEMTGSPVTEEQLYVLGSSMSGFPMGFPGYPHLADLVPIRKIVYGEREGQQQDMAGRDKIEEYSEGDSFLCWKKGNYVECPCVSWNFIKMPFVRINGTARPLSYREIARLKGFPDSFELPASNKAWLVKMLHYAPNVQVTKRIAEHIKDNLTPTPLRKIQKATGRAFEVIFNEYLCQKTGRTGKFQSTDSDMEWDFVYTYDNASYYFILKFYSSDFSVKQNIDRVCMRVSKKRLKKEDNLVLAVANVVPDEIKRACEKQYGMFVWDVKNLIWLFEEFSDIKNEFIALLNFSIENIEPEKPIPYIFHVTGGRQKDLSLKERLQRIEPGRKQYQEYEAVCIEILKYVLGDYLTLWYVQENTDHGMYRFDLCCKIKSGVEQDFFESIQNYFNTKYIVFEFKNYADKITQQEIYTTEKYLYEKALRRVAIIISKNGADEHALAAAKGSLRESGKLILCLSDKDLLELIDMKDKNEQSVDAFFEAMLDDLLIHLEK